MPVLSETEINARLIFISTLKELKRLYSRLPDQVLRGWAGSPNRAPAVLWPARRVHAQRVFGACKKIPGPSAQRENAPSTRVPCFGTKESARLSRLVARPDWPRHRAVELTSDGPARLRFRFYHQKSPVESPAPSRLRFAQ